MKWWRYCGNHSVRNITGSQPISIGTNTSSGSDVMRQPQSENRRSAGGRTTDTWKRTQERPQQPQDPLLRLSHPGETSNPAEFLLGPNCRCFPHPWWGIRRRMDNPILACASTFGRVSAYLHWKRTENIWELSSKSRHCNTVLEASRAQSWQW